LQSSLISDPTRARVWRALSDPYALAIAVLTAVAAVAFHWAIPVALVAALAVIAVRVVTEFVIPRGAKLEFADSAAAKEREVRAALTSAEAAARGRAPAEVQSRVAAISAVVLGIMERQAALGSASPQLFAVLRTATDYMPTALDAYMKLTPSYATTRRQADGRTALEILVGQLDLLEKEMVEVADAVNRNDMDRLLAHERFLTERFGRSALKLP
jgi:hypothetical protein